MSSEVAHKDNPSGNRGTAAHLEHGVIAVSNDRGTWYPKRGDGSNIPCERGFSKSIDALVYAGNHAVEEKAAAANKRVG